VTIPAPSSRSVLGLVDRLSGGREAGFVNRTQGETVVTARPVSIRRARVADREAVGDFFAGLSPRTRYLRFFGALTMSQEMLRVLSGGGDADAVVASRHGEIIGHGMATGLVRPGGGTAIEIGVVVADAWQGQGIGSALVRTLIGAARARDATIVAMDVLHANHRVLAMIASHWPAADVERSADFLSFRVRLARREPRRHHPRVLVTDCTGALAFAASTSQPAPANAQPPPSARGNNRSYERRSRLPSG
jgi:GNAT superfamily N-acetyltransferase